MDGPDASKDPADLPYLFYDRDGQPMTVEAWAVDSLDLDGRTLAVSRIGDIRVMTCWLGTADERADNGLPLIYGSIIKMGDEWGEEIRTPTQEAAMLAHELLVSRIRAGA